MRLNQEAVVLETIGVQEESDFKIKATGKAFRMLIDGLYSDKIGSMVREVCANADDAQTVAGWKEPFVVNIPNQLRPEFYVRDYGIGMDHDKVMKLYTTLFESDKDESDDLTGAFGLGSKSPFAYADQFSVSCYDGSFVRHYTAAIGAGGHPKIMLQGTEECVEPRGVRVTIGVDPKDFNEFKQAIRKVSLAYDPVFDTNEPLEMTKGELQFECANGTWGAYGDSNLPSTWNVRQGCVIYPLTSTGGLNLPNDNGRKWLINAPMGTIEITGSREQVQYKEAVVAFLQAQVDKILTEVEALVWDKIKDIKPVVEFFDTYNKLKPQFLISSVTHPVTGLTSPEFALEGNSCIYVATYDQHRTRWGYRVDKRLNLRTTSSSAPTDTYFLLRDFTPLLDPARDESTLKAEAFTKSETRRISRMLRVYLEAKKLNGGKFMLGVDKTATFWQSALPKGQIIEITMDELRLAAPRRVSEPKEVNETPPIRGLALAARAGDQRAVTAIDPKLPDVAWIDSDLYRRKPDDSFKVANRFGFKNLYIASPTARKLVQDANVPHLKDAIATKMLATHGVILDDFILMTGALNGYNSMATFAASVLKHDEALYDRLSRVKSPIGGQFKVMKPIIQGDLHTLAETERSYLRLLYEVEGKAVMPEKSPNVEAFFAGEKAAGSDNSYHPTKKYIDGLSQAKTAQQVKACAEGLILLLRAVPLEMKFRYS